jgi:hypothetical protein
MALRVGQQLDLHQPVAIGLLRALRRGLLRGSSGAPGSEDEKGGFQHRGLYGRRRV